MCVHKSPTIPPGEIDGTVLKYPATLTAAERKSQAFWTPEILQGVQDAQKKRAKMTKEERALDYEKTGLSLGMLPIETVREMREDDRKRKERYKQRGNTKRPSRNDGDAAVLEPLEIDNDTGENDNDNDKRDVDLFSKDSDDDNSGNDPNYDNDPDDDNDLDDDSDLDDEYTQSTNDKKTSAYVADTA